MTRPKLIICYCGHPKEKHIIVSRCEFKNCMCTHFTPRDERQAAWHVNKTGGIKNARNQLG